MTERKRPQEGPDGSSVPLEEIEGTPLPDELTGRASKTNDDLASLFDNETEEHIADGFRGGSDDEEDEPAES